MNPSDYTGCDIDKMQQIDNENYQNRYHNKSVKNYTSDVGKGPENIADLLKTKSSKEWIVDSFGARGSCVLLAGERDLVKPHLFIKWLMQYLQGIFFWEKSLPKKIKY